MDVRNLLYNMVYLPTMHRYGDTDGHQYIMGIFTDLERATQVAIEEAERRGGKYEWVIYGYALDRDKFESREETKTRVIRKSAEMNIMLDGELDEVQKDPVKLRESFKKSMQAKTKEQAEALEENLNYHQECVKWLLQEKERRGRK